MDRTRVVVVAAVLLVPLGGLEARLIHLQLLNRTEIVGDLLAKRRSLDLGVPPRGRLLDRHGRVLAHDEWAFDLYVAAEEFETRPEARADLGRLVGADPAELDEAFERIYQRIEKLMAQRPDRERPRIYQRERRTPYLLWKGLTREAAAAIETGGMERFPGLMVRESMRRAYPNGPVAGHVLGYLGRANANRAEYDRLLEHLRERFEELVGEDGVALLAQRGMFQDLLVGREGAERAFEERLRGRPGLLILERDPPTGRKSWTEILPAEPGEDIQLSIDLDLQRDVEAIVRDAKAESGLPAMTTAVVADPSTGEILAMGSGAGFDPNHFVPPTNVAAVRAYLADAERAPLTNRAVQSAFQVGSTFKLATSIAGLAEARIDGGTILECRGKYRENLATTNCWIWNRDRGMHGPLDLSGALERSCNCYFYRVGEDLGLGPLAKWADALGFGRRTGIELPGESRGYLPTPERHASWRATDTWSLSIGQHQLTATPLQVTHMICVLANGGCAVTPHVARGGGTAPVPIGLQPGHLRAVEAGLHAVVQGAHGTARVPELQQARAAGKTGSAQTSRRPDGTWRPAHAWFAGYLPEEAPRYALVVLMEHGGSGGHAAAPVAGRIAARLTLDDSTKSKNE